MLKQINKTYKCPNCKNVYLEPMWNENMGSDYIIAYMRHFKCNKCYGEFIDVKKSN